MLFYVYVLNAYLDNVTRFEHLGRMLDVLIGHLGYVEQSIVMHADINEAAEVYNVTHGTLELHALGKVGYIKNVR